VDAHKSRSIKWAEKQEKFQPKEIYHPPRVICGVCSPIFPE